MPEKFKLIPIEDASGTQFDRLRKGVKDSRGRLDVWVNPYPNYPGKEFFGNFEPSQDYKGARDNTLKRQGQVVIFEDNGMKDLSANLRRSGFRGEAIVIPTIRGEVDPNWTDWEGMGNHLKEAGVSSISLGGAFLWEHHASDEGNVRVPKFGELPVFDNLPFGDALDAVRLDVMKLKDQGVKEPAASNWVDSGYLPGGAVGLVALNFLRVGLNPSMTQASARPRR